MYSNKFYPAKKYKWVTTSLTMIKEMLIERRAIEKDNVILVTGARGDGKSTLTGKILFQFDNFDPYKQIVYTKEAFFKVLAEKNGYVWADEGIVNAARGNVMTRANKLLFEGLTINRDNFNIVFFLMPFVEDFDTKILQYCSAWIHIDSRGLAVLMLPSNKGLFGKRNWDIDAMKKLFDEFQKENQKVAHAPYWIYPNFRGYIKFGKLTLEQETIIKEIKFLRKNENISKELQSEVVMQVKEFDNFNKYSAKQLAELVAKGELRTLEQFTKQCTENKLDVEIMLKKCDTLLKRNNLGKSVKGLFRQYHKADSLISF